MKGVAILGATGSIGRSALAVLEQHGDRFRAVAVTANRNVDALERIADRYRPALAVVVESEMADASRDGTRWVSGRAALMEAATHPDVDIVINALVGAAGLEPTLAALRAGKRVALANKETLVCGGPLVLEAASSGGGDLVPVDSEHSAILQCLQGCPTRDIDRIILTASGGPFRTWSEEALRHVCPADALRHPTWDMGSKISIDSATLANKALEIIEAHFLFGVGYDRLSAVVHPQSIIHSMVEFLDGSVLAQMGFPTMEIPLLYAMAYPERLSYQSRRFDPVEASGLTFEPIREEAFPAFTLGIRAGMAGGAYPAVYNAANEIAVAAFLQESLSFIGIGPAIENALDRWSGAGIPDVESVLEADRWARANTETFIDRHVHC